MHGRQPQEANLRKLHGQKDRNRIVVARVAVEPDVHGRSHICGWVCLSGEGDGRRRTTAHTIGGEIVFPGSRVSGRPLRPSQSKLTRSAVLSLSQLGLRQSWGIRRVYCQSRGIDNSQLRPR